MKKVKEDHGKADEQQEDLDKKRFFTESITEFLKYTFSESEKTELGMKLAQCFSDCTSQEASLKSVQTQIKSEIAKIEAEMGSLSEKIRSGYEHRNVKCEKNFDYRLGIVTYTRLDNGDVYRERAMDESERQGSLDLGAEEQEGAEVNA